MKSKTCCVNFHELLGKEVMMTVWVLGASKPIEPASVEHRHLASLRVKQNQMIHSWVLPRLVSPHNVLFVISFIIPTQFLGTRQWDNEKYDNLKGALKKTQEKVELCLPTSAQFTRFLINSATHHNFTGPQCWYIKPSSLRLEESTYTCVIKYVDISWFFWLLTYGIEPIFVLAEYLHTWPLLVSKNRQNEGD